MASTVTQTGSNYSGNYKKVVFNWLSDAADGTVSYTTTEKFTGQLVTAHFVTGSVTPTDLYDVGVLNSDGADILGGAGANVAVSTGKSYTVASIGTPFHAVVDSTLTLTIANAGNAKTGKVVLIFADASVK